MILIEVFTLVKLSNKDLENLEICILYVQVQK